MLNTNKYLLSKLIPIYAVSVLFLIMFRGTVSTVVGTSFGNASLGLLLFSYFSPLLLLVGRPTLGGHLLLIYIIYVYLCFSAFLAVIDRSIELVPIIGLTNVLGPIFVWIAVFKLYPKDKKRLLGLFYKCIIVIGFINAIGAFIQGFISIDIFGLISNDVYANAERMATGGVEKRLISFISSPQSLGLSLAFSFVCSTYYIRSKKLMFFISGIIFFGGALTISKAFFVYVFFYFFLKILLDKRFKYIFFVSPLAIAIFFSDKFDRIADVIYFLLNIEKYSAYRSWMYALSFVDQFRYVITGRGLGIFSRGAQAIPQFSLTTISAESFFLQIFVELGLIGLVLISLLVVVSIIKIIHVDKHIALSILSFSIIGLFTPSMYGFVCGIQFSFLLVYSLLYRKVIRLNCYENSCLCA